MSALPQCIVSRSLLIALALATTAGCGSGAQQPISVMTRNLYLGADLSPLTGALTPADLAQLASDVWRDVQASRFPERALILADEIQQTDPDVVALQEVSLFRTQSPGDWMSGAPPDASTVSLDFLQLLQDALAARGASYRATVIGTNADEELPAIDQDGSPLDVRLTDRDVILVKESLDSTPGPAAIFQTFAFLPVGGAGGTTLRFRRGYVSADVTTGGKTVRIVNSHLEVGGLLGRFQEDQARELASSLAATSGGQVILAGDFNSRPEGTGTASYALLTTKAGSSAPFRDVWPFRQPHPMGQAFPLLMTVSTDFTCCLNIDSPNAVTQERIDLILFRGGVEPADAGVVDTARTPSGLWPSDHLGVFAEFKLR
ncbi:MAG: endonuclease/exonuclease/phosphatase family protein [Pseudomonadota bacterium]